MASRFASPKYYCETRASRKVVIPGPHLLWAVYMQRSYGPFGLLHKPPPDSRYAVSAYLVGCISPLARPNLCNLDPLAWLAGNAGCELLHGARLGLVWGQLLVTSSFAHRCSPTFAINHLRAATVGEAPNRPYICSSSSMGGLRHCVARRTTP